MKESQFFTPHNVMWTFASCLAIYLIAFGVVRVAPGALEFVFSSLLGSFSIVDGFLRLVPGGIQIGVGIFLFNRAKGELLY